MSTIDITEQASTEANEGNHSNDPQLQHLPTLHQHPDGHDDDNFDVGSQSNPTISVSLSSPSSTFNDIASCNATTLQRGLPVESPQPREVRFKSWNHQGTKEWRKVVKEFSDQDETYPEWSDEILTMIRDKLAKKGVDTFLVNLDDDMQLCQKIADGKWYRATDEEIYVRTKQRFVEDRKKRTRQRANAQQSLGRRPKRSRVGAVSPNDDPNWNTNIDASASPDTMRAADHPFQAMPNDFVNQFVAAVVDNPNTLIIFLSSLTSADLERLMQFALEIQFQHTGVTGGALACSSGAAVTAGGSWFSVLLSEKEIVNKINWSSDVLFVAVATATFVLAILKVFSNSLVSWCKARMIK